MKGGLKGQIHKLCDGPVSGIKVMEFWVKGLGFGFGIKGLRD